MIPSQRPDAKRAPRLGRANQLSVTEPDPQQLLTALTTEHFTLQGARSQTVGESASLA